jgi:hypothetical protein
MTPTDQPSGSSQMLRIAVPLTFMTFSRSAIATDRIDCDPAF